MQRFFSSFFELEFFTRSLDSLSSHHVCQHCSYNWVSHGFDRAARDRFIVYYKDQRMGDAIPLNLHLNAQTTREYHHD